MQQNLWRAATDKEISGVENLTLQKGPNPLLLNSTWR